MKIANTENHTLESLNEALLADGFKSKIRNFIFNKAITFSEEGLRYSVRVKKMIIVQPQASIGMSLLFMLVPLSIILLLIFVVGFFPGGLLIGLIVAGTYLFLNYIYLSLGKNPEKVNSVKNRLENLGYEIDKIGTE